MSASLPRRLAAVISAVILLVALAGPVAADDPQTSVGSVVFDPAGAYDAQTREITLTGTATCVTPGILSFFAEAVQQIGQHTVTGFGFGDAICTESLNDVPVNLVLSGGSGFNPGSVDVALTVFSCTSAACSDFSYDLTVSASPTSNAPEPVAPPPANDEASSATPVGYGTWTQSTETATGSETDPTCPGVAYLGTTVWFSFTAPDTGYLGLSTAGSSYDTVVVVLDAAGLLVGCNDDLVSGEIVTSDLSVPVTAGETYLILVGSWQHTPGGHLVLTLGPGSPPPPPPSDTPPANDERTGAVSLALGGPDETLTEAEVAAATEATSDPLNAVCEAPVEFSTDTVWYSVTPTEDGFVAVDTFGSTYDTVLYVFEGDTLLACNDQAGGNQSQVIWTATAGVTYHLMVGAWHGAPPGDLVIRAATSPAPLSVEVAVAGGATVEGGYVTVSGTVTCSEEAEAEIHVGIFQEGGRFPAEGSGSTVVSCEPAGSAWTVTVTGTSRFQNGGAFAFVEAHAFTTDGRSGSAFVEGELALSPAGANRR